MLGGVLVSLLDGPFDRQTALRAPWLVSALIHVGILVIVIRRLNTAALDAIRPGGPIDAD